MGHNNLVYSWSLVEDWIILVFIVWSNILVDRGSVCHIGVVYLFHVTHPVLIILFIKKRQIMAGDVSNLIRSGNDAHTHD